MSGTTFVTQTGELVYTLPNQSQGKSRRVSNSASRKPQSAQGVVLTETLVRGQVQEITGEHEARTITNSFHGNNPTKWQRNIPTYESVSLGEVYDGVEVQLKAYGNTVEKLFHVKAGAAPEQIRLKVKGGKVVTVAETGELEASTELGGVRFTKPVAYQEAGGKKEWVEVTYAVEGEEYGFRLGAYDRTRDLVIDPILAATFLGGSEVERVDESPWMTWEMCMWQGLRPHPTSPGLMPARPIVSLLVPAKALSRS